MRPGGTLEELIRMADLNWRANTKVIVVVGFLCDLSYRPRWSPDAKRGGLRLRDPAPLTQLTNAVTSADYAWRSRGISEIWSLPYVPNVLRYNRSVERTATGGDLTEDQVAEAVFSESQLHVILDEFKRILRDRGVVTVDLRKSTTSFSINSGLDGLHMSHRCQRLMLTALVEAACQLHPTPPLVPVKKMRSVAERASRALKKRGTTKG